MSSQHANTGASSLKFFTLKSRIGFLSAYRIYRKLVKSTEVVINKLGWKVRLSWIPICSTYNFALNILFIARFSETENENIFFIGS